MRGLERVAEAAMLMYDACPADPDATLKYEAAVDTFIDALAAAGYRMPASIPTALSALPASVGSDETRDKLPPEALPAGEERVPNYDPVPHVGAPSRVLGSMPLKPRERKKGGWCSPTPPAASERVCAVCGGYAGQMVAFVTGCAWICGPKCEERHASTPPAASEGCDCDDGTDPHEPADRGFVCEHRADRERALEWLKRYDYADDIYAENVADLAALLARVRAEATEAERAHENEACALLVDTLLGDGNHVSARIRQRPAKGER